jgi:hypothetical protein
VVEGVGEIYPCALIFFLGIPVVQGDEVDLVEQLDALGVFGRVDRNDVAPLAEQVAVAAEVRRGPRPHRQRPGPHVIEPIPDHRLELRLEERGDDLLEVLLLGNQLFLGCDGYDDPARAVLRGGRIVLFILGDCFPVELCREVNRLFVVVLGMGWNVEVPLLVGLHDDGVDEPGDCAFYGILPPG